MNVLQTIFDKMAFPLNVWKLLDINSGGDNAGYDAECVYSNDKLLDKNIKYSVYHKKYYRNYSTEYQTFLKNKNRATFETLKNCVHIEFVDENFFYELRYPKSHTDYILSSISFKIRNPLTNIVGILGIMDKEENIENQTIRNYMNILKKSSTDIIKVANDIIDLLNIKQNKIYITKEELYLEKNVKDCLNLVSKDAKKKKINLGFKIDKNLPKIIFTDRDRLKQIIINLLDNSITNTEVGSVTIDVSMNKKIMVPDIKNIHHQQYNILFKIRDTGVGIDDEKKNILNSILNIEDVENQRFPGDGSNTIGSNKLTGFGIYISSHLCNLLGGRMWFRSEKDVGTVFYFDIVCDGIVL